MDKKRIIYRSSITGQFVSNKYAKQHPATTLKQSVKGSILGVKKPTGTRGGGPKKI